MKKPKVQSLLYNVTSTNEISYNNPQPLSFSNDLGTFFLKDLVLKIEPSDFFEDSEQATNTIEPFLKAWEIKSDLSSNLGTIRFEFDKAEIIDLNPPAPGEKVVYNLGANVKISFNVSANLSVQLANYPTPPNSFSYSTMLEIAYSRWKLFKEGKEPLQSMSYFILTLIESFSGGRKCSATKLNIDLSLLRKVGELSSTRGSAANSRKANQDYRELAGYEKQWLESTTRLLIIRLGEYTSGCDLEKLTALMPEPPKNNNQAGA